MALNDLCVDVPLNTHPFIHCSNSTLIFYDLPESRPLLSNCRPCGVTKNSVWRLIESIQLLKWLSIIVKRVWPCCKIRNLSSMNLTPRIGCNSYTYTLGASKQHIYLLTNWMGGVGDGWWHLIAHGYFTKLEEINFFHVKPFCVLVGFLSLVIDCSVYC